MKSEMNINELENVAEAYEKRLVPAMFAEWAKRIAGSTHVQEGQRVLDVACGTGILARELASRTANNELVSGVDANPGMLAVAKRVAPQIQWREGDVESLPYDNDSFDYVLCQFGLMLFPEPVAALKEMKRVLKSGGELTVAVFGPLDDLPAYTAIIDVYHRQAGKDIADALRMPFSMGDTDKLASLFDSADIRTADIRTEKGSARFAGVREMVLADVKGWFPFAGIHLDDGVIDAITREAETALEEFQTAGGAVEFQVPVHIVTATKS